MMKLTLIGQFCRYLWGMMHCFIGNVEKGGKTDSLWLNSGDIVVMGGAARLKYHGIDKIRSGTSNLLKNGGRINLTLRVVD